MKIAGSILALFLFLNTCKNTQEISKDDIKKQLKGSFKLSKLNGKDISTKGLTFIIDKSSDKISGNSGCNMYNANFELSETNQITFSYISKTKRYCLEKEKNTLESNFLSILSNKFKVTLLKENSIELIGVENPTQRIVLIKK